MSRPGPSPTRRSGITTPRSNPRPPATNPRSKMAPQSWVAPGGENGACSRVLRLPRAARRASRAGKLDLCYRPDRLHAPIVPRADRAHVHGDRLLAPAPLDPAVERAGLPVMRPYDPVPLLRKPEDPSRLLALGARRRARARADLDARRLRAPVQQVRARERSLRRLSSGRRGEWARWRYRRDPSRRNPSRRCDQPSLPPVDDGAATTGVCARSLRAGRSSERARHGLFCFSRKAGAAVLGALA